MANQYYNEAFQGQAGQTARAEEVTSEFDGVQSGFDTVADDINRTLRGTGGEVIAEMPNAESRANTWLRFDQDGNPIPTAAPFNFRGAWQPNTLYYSGDVVIPAVHASLVICTVQHVSASSYQGVDWRLFVDLTGVPYFNYRTINTAGTSNLSIADSVFVDSSTGNIVLNLPSVNLLGSPLITAGSAPINITHVGGTLAAGQTIQVVATGGLKIMGVVETSLTLDVQNASFSLSFGGVNYGWRLRVMG